jgi:hypothetical protein
MTHAAAYLTPSPSGIGTIEPGCTLAGSKHELAARDSSDASGGAVEVIEAAAQVFDEGFVRRTAFGFVFDAQQA